METIICHNDNELISAITEYLDTAVSIKIGQKENFSLGLSGGSMVEILSKVLIKLAESKYRNIHFFFCDERYVDKSSRDFTFNLYEESLFSKRKTTLENIHKINLSLNLADSSNDYLSDIKQFFKSSSGNSTDIPQFDALFLGLGPDGHTASLFPNHRLLKDTENLIACLDDSPKPPSKRITMTLSLINSARNVCFVAVGESKADIVKNCINDFKLGGNEEYPASLVRPYNGRLIWYLNRESAKLCNELRPLEN